MFVLWLSEIKWGYLRTRKQQILTRFPADDVVLFVEPISKNLPNRFTFSHEPPVHYITLPHIRAVTNPVVNGLLNSGAVRRTIQAVSGLWLDALLQAIPGRPDILVTSDVYWSRNIATLKRRWPALPVVYDCNDNPMGFPRTPDYKGAYALETVEQADLITMPHLACMPVSPEPYLEKIHLLSNGVDARHYAVLPEEVPLGAVSRPVFMYTGAISEWFDFELMAQVGRAHQEGTVVLVGPIADSVRAEARALLAAPNILHVPPVSYDRLRDYLYAADVCLIPFVANSLTRPVVPNKLFEYAAAGRTTVMSPFNPDLKELAPGAYVADSREDFMVKLDTALHHPSPPESLRQWAAGYDWDLISRDFRAQLAALVDRSRASNETEQVPLR
ncbi:MAG: glycosyltransferase [Candidatus Neomarinimicrobiota bacterium]